MSGGMQQRVMIAMALAGNPKLLIADEPTTALDVTIQAQILELIDYLRKEKNMGVILITHNLGIVSSLADKVAMMYAGRIVEYADAADLFQHPQHPYTKALLSAVPKITDTPQKNTRILLHGEPPSPYAKHQGCPFAARCPMARKECSSNSMMLLSAYGNNHLSSCLYPEEVKNL